MAALTRHVFVTALGVPSSKKRMRTAEILGVGPTLCTNRARLALFCRGTETWPNPGQSNPGPTSAPTPGENVPAQTNPGGNGGNAGNGGATPGGGSASGGGASGAGGAGK